MNDIIGQKRQPKNTWEIVREIAFFFFRVGLMGLGAYFLFSILFLNHLSVVASGERIDKVCQRLGHEELMAIGFTPLPFGNDFQAIFAQNNINSISK